MKALIDRYVLAQIDKALDDARPLSSWSAWYVRRRPELRDYYEAMLEMEIELRFSEPEPEIASRLSEVSSIYHAGAYQEKIHRGTKRPGKRLPWRAILSSALIFLIGLLIYRPWMELPKIDVMTGKMASGLPERAPFQKTDIDDRKIEISGIFSLMPSLSETFLPQEFFSSRSVLPPQLENLSQESSLSVVPVETILRFSETPLEMSLTFLETMQIIRTEPNEKKI